MIFALGQSSRIGGRHRNQVALPQRNAQVADGEAVSIIFYALGNDRRRTALGEVLHRFDKMVLEFVLRNPVDEMPIDLDVVRRDLRPHAQIGKSFAQIVNGDLVAQAAVVRERSVKYQDSH